MAFHLLPFLRMGVYFSYYYPILKELNMVHRKAMKLVKVSLIDCAFH